MSRDNYSKRTETGVSSQNNEVENQGYHTQIHLEIALPRNRELIGGEREAQDCSVAHSTPEWYTKRLASTSGTAPQAPHTVTGTSTRGRGAVDRRPCGAREWALERPNDACGSDSAGRRWWVPRRRGRSRLGPRQWAHLGAPQWVPPVGASLLLVIRFLSIGLYAE